VLFILKFLPEFTEEKEASDERRGHRKRLEYVISRNKALQINRKPWKSCLPFKDTIFGDI
jgi:hypothetical protein